MFIRGNGKAAQGSEPIRNALLPPVFWLDTGAQLKPGCGAFE
jgi:hypothetical protein